VNQKLGLFVGFLATFSINCGPGIRQVPGNKACEQASDCAEHCDGLGIPECRDNFCICLVTIGGADAGVRGDASVDTDASHVARHDAGALEEDASSDAGPVLAPDAGSDDASSVTEDAGSADSGSPDAGPVVHVTVQNMDFDPVRDTTQKITDTTGTRNIGLSHFEICAVDGHVDLLTVTTNGNGQFGELFVKFKFDDADEAVRSMSAGIETVVQTPENVLPLDNLNETPDIKRCTVLVLSMNLPLPNERTRVIRPLITGISARQNIKVDFGAMNQSFTYGLRTVFNPEPGLMLWADNMPSREITIARNSENSQVAAFRICTMPYQTATVREAEQALELTVPSDIAYSVRSSVGYTDSDNGRWWPLSNETKTLSSSDNVLDWHANNPEHDFEVLDWGACIQFQLTLIFVPEGATEVQFAMKSVGATVPIQVRNFEGALHDFTEPFPWAHITFVDVSPMPPYIGFYYVYPRDLSQASWFLWEGEPTKCWLNGNVGGTEVECPLADIQGNVQGIDMRYPAQFKKVKFNLRSEGFTDVYRVRVEIWRGSAYPDQVLSRVVSLAPGNNEFVWDEGTTLSSENDFVVRIRIFAADPLPPEDQTAFVAPRLRFDFESAEATYANRPLDVYLNAPETPGTWSWALRSLPYQGPWFVFHGPEMWLENNAVGVPVQISVSEPPRETIGMNATFRMQYGPGDVCVLHLRHGTGKENPVASDISAQVAGTIFLMLSWSENEVVFRAPRRQDCVSIGALSSFQLTVKIGTPIEPTDPERPLQFKLFGMEALPSQLDGPLVPVIVALDGDGRREFISDEHSVLGNPIVILP